MALLVPVFDLDGTLLDSDEALLAPFLALGIDRSAVRFGPPVREECERLGVSVDDYASAYDPALAPPFPGVDELVRGLGRWAICSNKHPEQGRRDLALRGWAPEVALFSDAFGWQPKALAPVLADLGLGASEVAFVGDTAHDRAGARAVGCRFVLAGWNPRVVAEAGDLVAATPQAVPSLLTG